MASTVETRFQSKSSKSLKTSEDTSVIVDMGDINKSKKLSKRDNSNNLNNGENFSIFYEASLILDNVKPNQSGNYTCGPSNTLSASVSLHIIQGKLKIKIHTQRFITPKITNCYNVHSHGPFIIF